MGLTLDDFERLTPEEFGRVYESWSATHVRDSWERARFVARCALQPYSRRPLKATDVCRFGWDDAPAAGAAPPERSTRERFEELVRRTGARPAEPETEPTVRGASGTLSDRR